MENDVENGLEAVGSYDDVNLIPDEHRQLSLPFKVYSFFLLTASLFFILSGSININNCYDSPKLPFWMIVVGFFILFERIMAVRHNLKMEQQDSGRTMAQEMCDMQGNRVSRDVMMGMLVAALFGTICLIQLIFFSNWGTYDCSLFVSIPSFMFCFYIFNFYGLGFCILIVKKLSQA